MAYNSYFGSVETELQAIAQAAKESNIAVWVVLPVMFGVHAVVLAVVVWIMGWIFGNTIVVVGVTCAAYISAAIGWAVERVQQKVTRMAVHATSVHDEILLVKELIQDEQRRSS
jgi:uncharacterized membrane protein